MKPGHTTRELVISSGETMPALLMTLEDLRDEIGLFDDTSDDTLVFDYIHAATEQCAVILGQDPRPADVVDRFPAPRGDLCLELSRGWHDSAQSLTVKYLDAARVSQTMDAADFYLDDTGPRPMVVLTAAPAVHPVLAYPVSVSWRSELGTGRGYETLRQAIRYLVGLYYVSKGNGGARRTVRRVAAGRAIGRDRPGVPDVAPAPAVAPKPRRLQTRPGVASSSLDSATAVSP